LISIQNCAMIAGMLPVIRPLVPADVGAVIELSLRAWAPVHESMAGVLGDAINAIVYPDWAAQQADDVRAVCQDGTAAVWIAESGGSPAGFVAVRIGSEGTGEIDMIAVDPPAQRQGIGTALTQFAMRVMRDAGVRLAIVATGGDPGHAAARRTYEKAGFTGLPLVRYYARLDSDAPDVRSRKGHGPQPPRAGRP
jgi:ribosomal protein S18 acetylase RimI-like enzyme